MGIKSEVEASFTVKKKISFSRIKTIPKSFRPIPKFGFKGANIPGIGAARAGAFVKADTVINVDAEAKLEASVTAKRTIENNVRLNFIKGDFDVTTKQNSGGNPAATFDLQAEVGVRGFFGIRPAIGLVAQIGKQEGSGFLRATFGVNSKAKLQTTPFPPLTRNFPVKIGICSDCHNLQGEVDASISFLELETKFGGRTNVIIIQRNILSIRLIALCLIRAQCPMPM